MFDDSISLRNSPRHRLANGLRAAMKARDAATTAALRTLLAPPPEHGPIVGRSGDVPRRALSEDDVVAVLRSEAAERATAALDYERLGRPDEAARLRREIALVER